MTAVYWTLTVMSTLGLGGGNESHAVDNGRLAGTTHAPALKHHPGEPLAKRVNARHGEVQGIARIRDLVIAEFPDHGKLLAGLPLP